jgi:ribosome-binding factor A
LTKNNKSYKLNTRHKEQSQRQLKVAQTIHTNLVECFRRGAKLDPRLDNAPVSIVEVNISPDLRVANCFFVPFNTDLSVEQLLEALDESKYIIRDYITRQVNLKYSPEIRFYFDEGSMNTILVENLLKK